MCSLELRGNHEHQLSPPRIEISTARFVLRPLTEADVSEAYLSWLQQPDTARYIASASQTHQLCDLRRYVLERVTRRDVLFLGIFDRRTGAHIGNVKYEPIDELHQFAVMGILIGDPNYRRRGVAREVLKASGEWLRLHREVSEIILGVDSTNITAIRAYEKVGFVRAQTHHIPEPKEGTLTMIWRPISSRHGC